jgi:peptidoglycan/xylan/chitin deacetylase (PgdA/CDA1 family)
MDQNPALILMYHHIRDVEFDPGALSVSSLHFAEQLEVLRAEARPIALDTLAHRLFNGSVQQRSVVVTFDDGYQNNLLQAKPLLDHHDVPATFFITTGTHDRTITFWWDELVGLLLHPGVLPEKLELCIKSRPFRHDLGAVAIYSEDAALRFRNWREWEDPPTPRHALFTALHRILMALRNEEQRAVLKDLRRWAGIEGNDDRADRRLADSEISLLSGDPLISIGAHTVTHPMLSTLASDRQHEEIQNNKSRLEEILGKPVQGFSYPYGDYTRETIGIVREMGFACACSTIIGAVQQNTNPFLLPRHQVSDWDGDEFAEWLRKAWETA